MRKPLGFLIVMMLSACGETAKLPVEAVMGPHPALVDPKPQLIPTFKIAPAKAWPPGVTPIPAGGFSVNAFATGLDHPRWLYVLPNGDVLVAETNAPVRPEDRKGIKGWFMNKMSKKAGGAVPSANRITRLRDADGDGVAETRTTFLRNLTSPFGMALAGNDFYVADTDALLRYPYAEGKSAIDEPGVRVADLPAGTIFVPFANGQPSGPAEDVLTGFVDDKGDAHGRPVGVAVDKSGALLVADDVGNTIWRITPIR